MGRLLRACAGFASGFLIASSVASLSRPAQTSDYNPDVAAFVGDADHFVSLLHEGTTLGHWLDTRNPDDQWLEYEEECARFNTIDKLPSGIWIPWLLHFYPPPVPSPITFPDHGSRRDCVLGTVQVEAEVRGRPDLARLMDDAARQVFTYRYGQSVGGEDVPFWGPYSHPNAARWIRNVEIVSGHSSEVSHCNDLHGPLLGMGDTAFVCAHSALVRRLELDLAHSYRYRKIEDSQFHKALAIAGADPVLTDKLQNLYEQILHGNAELLQIRFQGSIDGNTPARTVQPPAWAPSLLPLLREWLAQVKTLPAERCAAGLLATDRLVLAAQTVGDMAWWPQGSKEPSPIEKLMAEFFPSEAAKGFTYTGNWAKQARELDPSGVVGQMAIIGPMARGSCALQDSDDPSRTVILEGEKLLSKVWTLRLPRKSILWSGMPIPILLRSLNKG